MVIPPWILVSISMINSMLKHFDSDGDISCANNRVIVANYRQTSVIIIWITSPHHSHALSKHFTSSLHTRQPILPWNSPLTLELNHIINELNQLCPVYTVVGAPRGFSWFFQNAATPTKSNWSAAISLEIQRKLGNSTWKRLKRLRLMRFSEWVTAWNVSEPLLAFVTHAN